MTRLTIPDPEEAAEADMTTEARDLVLLERHREELNRKAEDALEYQVVWIPEDNQHKI